MATRTRPQTTRPDYVRAPWHLRLRWWLAAQLWVWGESFEGVGAQSADQANPWWRR